MNIYTIAAVLLFSSVIVAHADPITFASLEKDSPGVTPYAVVLGGQVADTVTTLLDEAHGTHELNAVIGPHATRLLIAKSAASAVIALLIYGLGDQHPTIAKVLGYASGGVSFGMAVHNATIHTH